MKKRNIDFKKELEITMLISTLISDMKIIRITGLQWYWFL